MWICPRKGPEARSSRTSGQTAPSTSSQSWWVWAERQDQLELEQRAVSTVCKNALRHFYGIAPTKFPWTFQVVCPRSFPAPFGVRTNLSTFSGCRMPTLNVWTCRNSALWARGVLNADFGCACNFACASFCPRCCARSQMPAFGLLSDPRC